MKDITLEQLENHKEDIFKRQCNLDIEKAMVDFYIRKKKKDTKTKSYEKTKESKIL